MHPCSLRTIALGMASKPGFFAGLSVLRSPGADDRQSSGYKRPGLARCNHQAMANSIALGWRTGTVRLDLCVHRELSELQLERVRRELRENYRFPWAGGIFLFTVRIIQGQMRIRKKRNILSSAAPTEDILCPVWAVAWQHGDGHDGHAHGLGGGAVEPVAFE